MKDSGFDAAKWADGEVDIVAFRDKRLGERLHTMLAQMAGAIGAPIPMACQDWANTKAAYRFLSNNAVNEGNILAGHFQATQARVAALDGFILILQDTTEFSYQRRDPKRIGAIGLAPSRRDENGRLRLHTVCGLLMHSSLAITTEGLPLGLTAAKFWTRTKFKGTNALKRRINPTRVPNEEKESYRWLENMRQSTAMLGESERLVHIGDRGSVSNFVCGGAVEHYAVLALMKRSPKITANWAFAMVHSRGGILHSFSDLFKTR